MCGRVPSQGTVRPHGVVVDAPGFDQGTRLDEAGEPLLIETLVAELPVEALDERILDRLARPDKPQLHAASIGPGIDGAAAEFWPVVHDQDRRQADRLRQAVKDA